jgi:hypothetical protein
VVHPVVAKSVEQLTERVRLLIWEDMLARRVAFDVRSWSELARDGSPDYLTRAGVRGDDDGPVDATTAREVLQQADSWIRERRIPLSYGAFTTEDAAMLRHYVAGIAKRQSDVRVVASIAEEWLAGQHSTMCIDQHRERYGSALLALTNDVVGQGAEESS